MTESSPHGLGVVERRTHRAERDCQVVREATESLMRSNVCGYVLTLGDLSEVLSRGNSESAAESPKCLYQSGSEAEDTVQRIESLTQTCARVLREELGGNVASKSIASSRPRQTGGAQSVREA